MNTRFFIATLVLACSPALVQAQVHPLSPFTKTSVGLEVLRVSFPGGPGSVDFSASTLTYFLSAQTELRPGMRLLAELPVSHSASPGDGALRTTVVGNPYVGLLFAQKNATLEIGGRAPLYSGDPKYAGFTGYQADIDRQDAFFYKVAMLRARLGLRTTLASGLSIGGSAGPVLQIETDPQDGDNGKTWELSYGGDVGYRSENLRVGGRWSGLVDLSIPGSWGSRSYQQVGVFGDFGAGRVRPGAQLSIPVGQWHEDVSWVLGLNVQVAVR